MEINIVSYGIARDIIGGSRYKMDFKNDTSVGQILNELRELFPKFNQLTSLLIAVNDEYADTNYIIKPDDEIVIIPPVSGG